MNAAPPPLPGRVDRTPILFSALIYPGVGQYMTGRHLAGLAYAACFTIAFGVFLVFFTRYFRETVDFLRAWWAGSYIPEADTPSPRQLMMPFVYVLVTYVANVYDVTWHLYKPRTTTPPENPPLR